MGLSGGGCVPARQGPDAKAVGVKCAMWPLVMMKLPSPTSVMRPTVRASSEGSKPSRFFFSAAAMSLALSERHDEAQRLVSRAGLYQTLRCEPLHTRESPS